MKRHSNAMPADATTSSEGTIRGAWRLTPTGWPGSPTQARIRAMALAPNELIKFAIRIRTRGGLPVDNLVIHARDRHEAERRINQMYLHCEIVECRELQSPVREEDMNFENIITLISRTPGDKI
jgi:hypothetical protein